MNSNHWTLTPRGEPPLRLDVRALQPMALASLTRAEIERLPIAMGRVTVAVADWFAVKPGPAAQRSAPAEQPTLHLEGDCRRVDRIAFAMTGGAIHVHGSAGHHAATAMQAGDLIVEGDAGDHLATELRGGRVAVRGSVGHFACATLPGSMEGMRGGTVHILGNAGERLADRMRRGTLVVHGDVGAFACSRLVAGTVALGARVGEHLAWGMRRGSIVLAAGSSAGFHPPDTFAASGGSIRVAWALMARALAPFGGAFAQLPERAHARWVGDAAVGGLGEVLLLSR